MKSNLLHIAIILGIVFGLHTVFSEATASASSKLSYTGSHEETQIYRRQQVENFVIHFTNQIRTKNGLSELGLDQQLTKVARSHSDDMIIRNYTGHISPEGSTPLDRVAANYRTHIGSIAENVWILTGDWKGAPYNETTSPILLANRIVDEWMASPSHRKNILTENLSHIGVGISVANGKMLVTQLLANRMALLDQPLPPSRDISSKLNISLKEKYSFSQYKFCFESIKSGYEKKYVAFTMANRSVSTPDKTGIYRLILLIKTEDKKYQVYPGPMIAVKSELAEPQNILTALYSHQ